MHDTHGKSTIWAAGGGGGSEIRYHEGFRNPPPLFTNGQWAVLRVFFDASTPFVRKTFGNILLDPISTVLSLPPMQPLLILSPLLGNPENEGVT